MAALDGMRILDMTQYEAGTSCTQMLAWLGADVVKVERPEHGDPGRRVGGSGVGGSSAYFLNYNSNKRSVALSLRSEEGRSLLLQLVPKFDAFVENYGPGVMEKLGIGYDVMRTLNPRIIYARIKGFGLSGPYSGFNCYDQVAQATGGSFSVTGERGGTPLLSGATFADSGTGAQLALAITAAYVQQQRTGEGQLIELSMQEAVTTFMRTQVALFSDWGRKTAPRDAIRAGFSPDPLACKPGGSNDYIYMVIVTPEMWAGVCETIERPDLLQDERFATLHGRRENRDALHAEIAQWTATRTKYEAMEAFGARGVPCGAVMDTRDLFENPHLQARDFIQYVDHPTEGRVPLMRPAARLANSPVTMEPAPLLGQHTDEVLRDELGLDDGELATLREAGTVG